MTSSGGMTASEILREAASDSYVDGWGRPENKLASLVGALDAKNKWNSCMTDREVHDGMLLLADRIDAEQSALVEAQQGPSLMGYSAHYIMQQWGERNGVPFQDRECITEWLERNFERRYRGPDGLPMEVGQKVWHTSTNKELTIIGIEYGRGLPIEVQNPKGDRWYASPEVLAHSPVDTQSLINADALKGLTQYWECRRECEYGKECPSMKGWETPQQWYGVESCLVAQKMDLLRRQHELDARTMGGEA